MSSPSEKIAVIGISCRYPGADSMEEYWQNLLAGRDTIRHFTDDELKSYEIDYENLKNNPDYVPARGILNDVDKFDAEFFGMTPHEAEFTDPQHRVWLETSWSALEDANCDPYSFTGNIGVYAGGYLNTYLLNNILRDKTRLENYIRLRTAESFQIITANDIAYLPTKTAYHFDLRGPAVNVQTACSTSLVAIVQACNSLFNFESDICIAGGVCITTPQESGYIWQEGAIPSPDGHCRPFDAEGNGTVFSNGVGAVVLKRLEDAQKNGDHIYAVISGWALNNDGKKKVSFTAPGIEGQVRVIRSAQAFAGIHPEDLCYIEAHGTATSLGDPVEINALTKAFSYKTSKKQYCGIGSVKSNIGHTDAAAGVASFIKLCLSAYHRTIPPSIHFHKPNPHINFEETPFYVADQQINPKKDQKLIMGVSSFGIGGTNAHVILEEPPEKDSNSTFSGKKLLIPLSAKSPRALRERKKMLVEFVQSHPGMNSANLVRTLWHGRSHMPYRSIATINALDELHDPDVFEDGTANARNTCLTFMFPGQGAQFVGMGESLYRTNDRFREIMDEGFAVLDEEADISLKEILFGVSKPDEAEKRLSETALTQPALFLIEYAMAQILEQHGVRPKYLIGHSIGEYTAACIAGVFDFRSALLIVARRGALMQSMPGGSMYAVLSTYEQLDTINSGCYEIAAENAPGSCTISFTREKREEVVALLDRHEIKYLPLNTSHAFHSHDFEPILDEFASYVDQFEPGPPQIPMISCLTGKFLAEEDAQRGAYWAKQLRNTVRFSAGIETIFSTEQTLLIEVGPNVHLCKIASVNPGVNNTQGGVFTIGRPSCEEQGQEIEKILARIWTQYENYKPDTLHIPEEASFMRLPTYPFQRDRYWIDYKPGELIETTPAKERPRADQPTEGISANDRILRIWQEVLGNREINPDDNFFDIGGNSLIAITLVSKIEKEFSCTYNLRNFFEAPSISGIASRLQITLADEGVLPEDPYGTDSNIKIIEGEI